MRAVIVKEFGAPAKLAVEDLEAPRLQPDEVLIEARAIGVNFPDLLVVAGEYQTLPALPFSPGKEVAGVVLHTGGDVTAPRTGERVMAQVEYGAYREQVVAKAAACTVLPDELSFDKAAAFGLVYLTAYFGLVRRAALQAGEWVLVTGAGGGIGSAGVQLAKALGARVIAVARKEDKRTLALEQGADHAIDAEPERLRDRVRNLTGGHGADVVLESVGGEVFAQCLRALAWEGRLVVIGFAGGEIPTVKAGHLLVKNVTVIGLQASDYRDREPASLQEAQRVLLDLQRQGRIDVPVTMRYPLAEAAAALEAVGSGRVRGKVVLTPDPPPAATAST